ncbi:Hypothetical predicted protein [Paramuricea clavata]|uniref:Uncharacterized protein n=1 Tax=Paramuricea clavata TaxID=317549 RepID=A0A7D9DS95_PARCT|nr:Hypothetical predicted protein [Paramuricea clavata]
MNFPLVEKTFYVLCLINWFLSATKSEDIYVSNKATKVKNCGLSEDVPCPTINAAIQIAKEHSQINIVPSDVAYKDCPVYVNKPVAFNGIRGNPVIDCGGKDAFIFNFGTKGPAKRKAKKIKEQPVIKLDVSNLKIQNSKTGFSFLKPTSNANLRLENIEFVKNDIDISWSNSYLCYLVMTNVKTFGSSGNAIDIKGCNKTTMLLSNTKFNGKYFRVISTDKSSTLDIKMDRVVFDMSSRAKEIVSTDSNKEIQFHSPMHIVTALKRTAVTIKASKFSNHFGERNSMINVTAFQKTKNGFTSPININFNNVTFSNNTVQNGGGGAISFNLSNKLTKNKPHIIVFNASTFIDNSASNGGAVWFSDWEKKKVQFNGSTFIDNKALGTEDENGNGGALFVLGGKFLIKISKFEGNMATKAGGTLYLYNKKVTSIKVSNSVFQNKRSWSRIEGGVMYFSDVPTFFSGKVVFNLSSSNSGESMFLYEGRPSLLRMSNTSVFICPKGYNYEEPKYIIKLKSSKQQKFFPVYHIFAFSCKPCQDLFYSTARGFRQANETETRGKCHVCPYGASCNGTIRARANFWGKVEGDKVKMIPCPKGYCCDREPCESYDSCRAHRTGTLCGHCSDGYTESMSSTKCFPNEECDKVWWLWPVFNVFGIFVILCFHQEVR